MAISFGEFAFDPERRQLLRSGEPVPLETKAYELLGLLLSRRPNALSKTQIRAVLWPDTFVSESALARLVTQLRASCGDDAQNPQFIRTVHGFGYAFCGDAREARGEAPVVARAESEASVVESPYPGLASFAEADANRFFGREREVEALWEKTRRQSLLAVIGPSGVGKTSLLRAGVIPRRPSGWGAVACVPGAHPFVALGQALAQALTANSEAVAELLRGVSDAMQGQEPASLVSAASRWRRLHTEALLVLDQFEELFTLNVPEVQARFARLIGRLVEDSGLRVVLGLRDDFFMRCSEHPALAEAFRDVTPLLPPSPEGLKRALREPAAAQGVRFEDDALVDEMTAAVSAERGALPLLAFTASRLWEERDRDRRLLTREAYERVGGIGGALAQHAEATLQPLGAGREPIVRELFRNLATSQGTRASRDRAELLSIFGPDGAEPGQVLDTLVAARLLTEYDAPEHVQGEVTQQASHPSASMIEIAHESLLTHWPRLVRWQTQDADGAQLRDQLRQAAQLWHERGRRPDLLWTGASYVDYLAWRSRYSGQLSSLEEAFTHAQTGLANQRRRLRRIALAAVVAVMAIGLGVLATFWSRSESARRRADAEALRAESSKLLALGQTEQERYPTAAIAYSIKSLELTDTDEARRFALRVLQDAPTALFVDPTKDLDGAVAFSPNGQWLSLSRSLTLHLLPWNGSKPVALAADFATLGWTGVRADFARDGNVLVGGGMGDLRTWSVPEGREIQRLKLRIGEDQRVFVRGDEFLVFTTAGGKELIERGSFRDGGVRLLGSMEALHTKAGFSPIKAVDAGGTQLAYGAGRNVFVRSLRSWDSVPRLVGTHPGEVIGVAFHPDGRQLAASDRSGQIRLWSTAGAPGPLRVLSAAGVMAVSYSSAGRWLGAFSDADAVWARLWDLAAPAWAEPLVLRSATSGLHAFAFDPKEQWLATAPPAALWPLGERYPRSGKKHAAWAYSVAFSLDGSTLLSASGDQTLRAWPMSPNQTGGERVLLNTHLQMPRLSVDPRGGRLAVTGGRGRVLLMSLAGGPTRELRGFSDQSVVVPIAFSPDGRHLAAASVASPAAEKVVRVWDLEKGGVSVVLGPFPGAGEGEEGGMWGLAFLDDDRLLASSPTAGILLLDRRDGSREQWSSRPAGAVAVGRRHGTVVAILGEPPELVRLDLDGRATRLGALPQQRDGDAFLDHSSVALDPTETMVAMGGRDGIVRIAPISGGEPHLLYGHTGPVFSVAFSPDGLWLASGSGDNTVRLWPVPDVAKVPFHKRSREEVLAKLQSWTNLRVVPDAQSPTGWKLQPGPFTGWQRLPAW